MRTSPNSDERVRELFHRLRDDPAETWGDALRALDLDTELATEVRSLLDADLMGCPRLDSTAFESFPVLASHGSTSVDEFEIIRRLGSGGMGVVYLAEDKELDRHVAIKVLPSMFTQTKESVERFRNEAKTVAGFDHSGIVPVYRWGRWDGSYYIASAYIEGETLAERIKQNRDQDGVDKRWVSNALEVVRAIAGALDYAHQRDVIHRDVKPANILLDTNGRAHLADFGVAKTARSQGLTLTSESPGTPAYMSPEQAHRADAPIDPRSDIYSLGAVLYECLTFTQYHPGGPPKTDPADEPEYNSKLRIRNRAISVDVETVCRRALEWAPELRYQSAGEFAEDLDRAIRGVPVLARRQPAHRVLLAYARRHAASLVVGASILAAALTIGLPRLIPEPAPTGLLRVDTVAGATISHQRFDPETLLFGPATPIGSGAASAKVPPGRYRIVVESGEGLAEHTREVARDRTTSVRIDELVSAEATAGMIFFPAGPAVVGMPDGDDRVFRAHTVELGGFWIDPTEVTNAEYRAYVEATGAAPPPVWPDPYDTGLDSQPVVGVTFAEASGYAEWRGKRLPTVWEWERASRGSEGRRYPWGDEFDAEALQANIGVDGILAWRNNLDDPEIREGVRRRLLPATAPFGRDITPEGGLHFYGNAAEFVDSLQPEFAEDGTARSSDGIIVKGRHWNDEGDGFFSLDTYFTMKPGARTAGVGFRCARSAAPAPPAETRQTD